MASTSLHFFRVIWALCLRLVYLIFRRRQKDQLPIVSPPPDSIPSSILVHKVPAQDVLQGDASNLARNSDKHSLVQTPPPVQRVHLEVPSSLPRNAVERNRQTKARLAQTKRNTEVYITDWAIFAPQANAVRLAQPSPPEALSGSVLNTSRSDSVLNSAGSASTSGSQLSTLARASATGVTLPAHARTSLRTYFTFPAPVARSQATSNHLPLADYSPPPSPPLSSPPATPRLPSPPLVPAILVMSPPTSEDYPLDSKSTCIFDYQSNLNFAIETKPSSPMGPKVKKRIRKYERVSAVPLSPPLIHPPPCYIPTRVFPEPVFLWDPPSSSLEISPKALLPSSIEDTPQDEPCPEATSYAEVFDFAIYLKRISQQCKSVRLSQSLPSSDFPPISHETQNPDGVPMTASGSLASSATSSQAMDDIVALLDGIKDEEVNGRAPNLAPFGWTEKEFMRVFA